MTQIYKSYKNSMQDGRRKISPEQYKEIIKKRKDGMKPKNLAQEYKVSVSLIKYIIYPKLQETRRERNKMMWKDYQIHYGKEYHMKAIRKWRAKKRKLGLATGVPEEKKCLVCGKTFIGRPKQKYCDKKCRQKVNNENRKK